MNEYYVTMYEGCVEDVLCTGIGFLDTCSGIIYDTSSHLFSYYYVYASSKLEVYDLINTYFKSPHQISINSNYFNDGNSR